MIIKPFPKILAGEEKATTTVFFILNHGKLNHDLPSRAEQVRVVWVSS